MRTNSSTCSRRYRVQGYHQIGKWAKIATAEAWNVCRTFSKVLFFWPGDPPTKECAGPLRDIIIEISPYVFFLDVPLKSSATFFFFFFFF